MNNMQVNVVATKQFMKAVKQLKKKHKTDVLRELYDIVNKLRNLEITTQSSNHWLKDADDHKDIHLDGGNLILMYKYITTQNGNVALMITLRLQDIVDHTELKRYDKKKFKADAKDFDVESIRSSQDRRNILRNKFWNND